MRTKRTTFWMVYGMNQGQPTVRHHSEDSATTEASRLARLHPGIDFYVMEATYRVFKKDVETERLSPDDCEIPF